MINQCYFKLCVFIGTQLLIIKNIKKINNDFLNLIFVLIIYFMILGILMLKQQPKKKWKMKQPN